MTDARFEDAGGGPLRLRALDPEDLPVISALVQDAVLTTSDMSWNRRKRRFAALVNRIRREEPVAGGRPPERVRAILAIEDVRKVSTQGIDAADADTVLSVLSLTWEPGEDGTGRLVMILAGDGAIGISVEALDATLTDVTRPYRAISGQMPDHGV